MSDIDCSRNIYVRHSLSASDSLHNLDLPTLLHLVMLSDSMAASQYQPNYVLQIHEKFNLIRRALSSELRAEGQYVVRLRNDCFEWRLREHGDSQ